MRGNEPELLKKIGGGDWSDETVSQVHAAVEQFAEDFGFDLDEEGHPIDEQAPEPLPSGHRADGGQPSEDGKEHSDQPQEQAA